MREVPSSRISLDSRGGFEIRSRSSSLTASDHFNSRPRRIPSSLPIRRNQVVAMILNGSVASGIMAMKPVPCNVKHNGYLAYTYPRNSRSHLSIVSAAFPKLVGLTSAHQERKVLPLRGGSIQPHLGASISPLGGDFVNLPTKLPWSPCRSNVKNSIVPRASKNLRMETKPKWWWRSLACVPYLLPISDTLLYAEAGFQLKNFLEDLDFLTNPLIDTFTLLPGWAMLAMSYMAYIWVVRKKDRPHFLRFHVVMAMLLSSAVQIAGIASNWLPHSVYKGRIQSYFWTTFVFVQLFTVLECIRCALGGMYPEVPFVKDAAYIHTEA
ncbi:hypothetical protein J5N97_027149 [Dioscorea zingiberensis]|uniref:Protein TIC 20 n=1 Tax=Dioscorea zingiberensis TaxID=325984 RepID=A0A9D5C3G6_9LILI|nr:hypothetical protein J5N97_027149 [Dioscorea zingiberensis]